MKLTLLILTLFLLLTASFGAWWYFTDILPEKNNQNNPGDTTPPAQEEGEEEETPPNTTGSGEVVEVSVSGDSYSFNPSTFTVPRDTLVRLTFTNVGSHAHDFAIPALGVATPLVAPGSSRTIEFTVPSEPGSVEYICSVLGHKDLGMRGTLIIE
ncbi:MAG: cupredoxin domain-containing protein [Patescibacteria group bacterium]